ncbi:MAG: hypothetical protein IJF02_05500 [Oscillospiraceae bacterium]|nr:hypothetical protein [Oscillospiraceae bacterium]
MYFFFYEEESKLVWRQYMEELGIQKAIDSLKAKGLPCEWPEKVVDLNDPATLKATVTASLYKSQCPHYGGYWLCGGTGSVECAAAGELLPGIVWYEVCSKEHCKCPFYKTHIKEDKQ